MIYIPQCTAIFNNTVSRDKTCNYNLHIHTPLHTHTHPSTHTHTDPKVKIRAKKRKAKRAVKHSNRESMLPWDAAVLQEFQLPLSYADIAPLQQNLAKITALFDDDEEVDDDAGAGGRNEAPTYLSTVISAPIYSTFSRHLSNIMDGGNDARGKKKTRMKKIIDEP